MSLIRCFPIKLPSSHLSPRARLTMNKAEDGGRDQRTRNENINEPPLYEDLTDRSPLLSLPKEIRCQIWRYVLTDTCMDKLYVRIQRQCNEFNTSGERFSNSLHKKLQTPEFLTCLEKPRSAPVNVGLLRVNPLIYIEGLPILYESAVFCPWNLEGIFPLFLDTLSPFARSNIRHIRLNYNRVHSKKGSSFHWALVCAQVAKLSESLRLVEVTCHTSPGPDCNCTKTNDIKSRAFLYPLLKIKTPKRFVPEPEMDAQFQSLLQSAAKELESKYYVRKASTAADARERARRDSARRTQCLEISSKQTASKYVANSEISTNVVLSVADWHKITDDLNSIPGIKQFERELSDWDVISNQSYSTDSSTSSIVSIGDDDTWTDAASTIVCKEDHDDRKTHDEWEFIEMTA